MPRKKKEKIDCSKERREELLNIINLEKDIYDRNSERENILYTRKANEITRLTVKFFQKVYKNIPIIFTKYENGSYMNYEPDYSDNSIKNINKLYDSLRRSKIIIDGEKVDLCEIEINETYWKSDRISFRIRFSDDYNKTPAQMSEKLKYLTSVVDRVSALEEDYVSERLKLVEKYRKLNGMIDTRECYDKWQTAKKELENIQDHLKFEPNLVYVFDSARFQYGRRKTIDYTYIKKLKIVNTTPVYCFVEYSDHVSEENEYKSWKSVRIKKEKILSLLRENKYTFEKNVERTKKLERLLEKMAD